MIGKVEIDEERYFFALFQQSDEPLDFIKTYTNIKAQSVKGRRKVQYITKKKTNKIKQTKIYILQQSIKRKQARKEKNATYNSNFMYHFHRCYISMW